MKMNELYPSSYLKCEDLQGKRIKAIVEKLTIERLGDDKKPVLHFRGAERMLVLNKTNASVLSDAYGDDSDQWIGKPVIIKPARVNFQGKMVDAIRLEIPEEPKKAQQQAEREPGDDSDMPF
jgi:hypothetical protein